MPVVAKRYKVKFEQTKLQFSEDYPSALSDVLTLAEFDSVVRKINEEMSEQIRARQKKVHKWSAVCIGLCFVVAGLCLTPVVLVQTRRQRKETKAFWERLRTYLGEINRKTFLKRNLEWKLVEDKRKVKRCDVANPLLAYRIEVVYRVQKGKATGSRLGAESTTSSRSGVGGSAISRGTASSSFTSRSQRKSLGAFSISSFNTEPTGLATAASISSYDLGEDGKDAFSEGVSETIQQGSDLDDIVIMEEDEDEYGEGMLEDESGNLASSSSQGGAGSYSRGSLIIDPMAAPIAASSLALVSTKERPDEGRAATASLPKPKTSNDEERAVTVPAPGLSEDEERASAVPLPKSSEDENDVIACHFPDRQKRLSKVRFSGLFDDDKDEH